MQGQLRIFVRRDGAEEAKLVGPIAVAATDTIGEVERRIEVSAPGRVTDG